MNSIFLQHFARTRRLGILLASFRIPWIAVGDWNISPADLSRTGFVERSGSTKIRAVVEFTCVPTAEKKTSHQNKFKCIAKSSALLIQT